MYLFQSDDSVNNNLILERVKSEIVHHVGGEDKCQWSDQQIEGMQYITVQRYF
jgi:hypothetical protein